MSGGDSAKTGRPGTPVTPRRRARGARTRRGLARQAPTLVVLAVVAAGLVAAASGRWRTGSGLIGLSLVLAAGLRLVLPPARAGWLVVRARAVDAALLVGTGAAVLVLASTIPRG